MFHNMIRTPGNNLQQVNVEIKQNLELAFNFSVCSIRNVAGSVILQSDHIYQYTTTDTLHSIAKGLLCLANFSC